LRQQEEAMAETVAKSRSRGPLVLAIIIMALGIGDLLTVLDIVHGIDWAWTLGLAVAGMLTFVLSGGVDKVSVVLGPLLLAASALSLLRQTGRLNANVEVPLLVITAGALLLVAQLGAVPPPKWIGPPGRSE
jgi:hypothetical protein